MKVDITRTQDLETPQEVCIVFSSTENAYEQNAQYARRHSGKSVIKTEIELAIAMSPSRALAVSRTTLYVAAAGRLGVRFESDLRLAKLRVGKCVRLNTGNLSLRVRITGKDDGDGITKFEGVTDNKYSYEQLNAIATGGIAPSNAFVGGGIKSPALSYSKIYDLPRLEQDDPNPVAYVAVNVGPGAFPGANLYIGAAAGGFRTAVPITRRTTCGSTVDILHAPQADQDEVDELSTVIVELGKNQTLSSVTRAQLLAGANKAIVGREVLQFQDAELVGVDRYKLKNLLRSRKGTLSFADKHGTRDDFVLLSTAVRLPILATDVNQPRTLYTVTLGSSMSSASMAEFMITDGGTLGPYAPDAEPRVFADGEELAEHETTDVRRLSFKGVGETGDYVELYPDVAGTPFERFVIGDGGNWSWISPTDTVDGIYEAGYKYVRVKPQGPVASPMSPTFEYIIAPVAAPAGEYRYYRVSVSANHGGAFTMINTWKFFDSDDNEIPVSFDVANKATADNFYAPANFNPWKAFDADPVSFWGTMTALPHWLMLDFGENKAVARVEIKMGEYTDSHLKDFTIDGSTDLAAWDVLATVVNAEMGAEFSVISVDL